MRFAKNEAVLTMAILAALGTSAGTTGVQTDLRAGLAKCAAIASGVARLDCFDTLAKGRALPAASAGPETPLGDVGKWEVDIKTNPVDDSRTVILILKEEDQKAGLILRCQQGKPEVYIGWLNYLGSDEPSVLTRVGDQPAETRRWSLSTDKRATFYPGDDGKLMLELEGVDRFVAQVTPYSESPVTAVFDVRGLSKAIEPLASTCKIR
jgi:type VI secretion system protein VasI